MYNKTIKKSIAFITLLSIVFSCFSSLAAVSIVNEDFVVSIPNYTLSADNVVNVDPQDQNGYYLATYRVKITPSIYFRGSGYANGHFNFYPSFALYDGQGNNQLQIVDIKIEGESLLTDSIYTSVLWNSGTNNGSCRCFGAFNNYYVESSQDLLPFPSFWVEIKYYLLSENYRPTLTLSVSSGDASSTISYSNTPTNDGLADIITASIVEALGTTSDTNSVIELLYSILTEEMAQNILVSDTNSLLGSVINNLSALQGYVDGVEGILTNIYNKIALLYDNIDTLIDTISWTDCTTDLEFTGYSTDLNGTYSTTFPSGNFNTVYMKYRFINGYRNYGLFLLKNRIFATSSNVNIKSVKMYVYNSSNLIEYSGICHFNSRRQDLHIYFDYNDYVLNYSYSYIVFEIKSSTRLQYTSNAYSLNYLLSSDIEYWYLMTYFVNYDLLHSGEEETEVQNELAAAATQMEQAAAAMDVTKPAPNTVLPESLVSGDIAAAQGTLFSWLNNNYILSILIACFTIALIGFVIYGKSG